MTLVITEVSKYGVVMVADSAITERITKSDGQHNIEIKENDGNKLLVIEYLDAGISWWGEGEINGENTELWLEKFIEKNKNCKKISDFAKLLENSLREELGLIDYELGFHLSGYEQISRGKFPTFYHITNSAINNCFNHEIKQFEAQPDYTAEKYDPSIIKTTRNGDYFIYANVSNLLQQFFNQLVTSQGIIIPVEQSIHGREKYLRFYMQMIKDIFSISNLPQTIGGKISSMEISSNGIISHEKK